MLKIPEKKDKKKQKTSWMLFWPQQGCCVVTWSAERWCYKLKMSEWVWVQMSQRTPILCLLALWMHQGVMQHTPWEWDSLSVTLFMHPHIYLSPGGLFLWNLKCEDTLVSLSPFVCLPTIRKRFMKVKYSFSRLDKCQRRHTVVKQHSKVFNRKVSADTDTDTDTLQRRES